MNLSYQGIALADFCEKAAATESTKVVDHVDEVHSVPAKNNPLLPDFCHPDVPTTGNCLLLRFLFFCFLFLMWTIFKVFIEFVTILLLFYVLLFLTMRHVGS